MKPVVIALLTVSAFAQNAGVIAPVPLQQPLDNSGRILGGSCMYTYAAGTTTPQLTYSNSTLMTANANPTLLDAFGRLPAVYLSPVAYKFVFAYPVNGSCPGSPGAVVWSQDQVYDFGQLLKVALATSAGAGLVGFEPTGGNILTNVGAALNSAFIYDNGFTSGASACGSSITVAVTTQSIWNAMATQTCHAPLWFPTGAGVDIQPGTGQVVTLSGSITAAPNQQIFDTSLGGAGSILLTGQLAAIYPNWFGATMSGTGHDDLAAWKSALAALPSGGSVRVPDTQGNCSYLSGTLSLPANLAFDIGGTGRTSIVCGTAQAIVKLTYAGQVLHDLYITDSNSAGNTATIGVDIDGGGIISQVALRNMTIIGSQSTPKGKGVQCNGAETVLIDGSTIAYWNYGVETVTAYTSPCNAMRITNSNLVANAARQFSNTGGGDVTVSNSDVENGPIGIYAASGQLTIRDAHFEAGSSGIDLEVNAGSVQSAGNEYIGGSVEFDSGMTGFTSFGEANFSDAVVNNSTHAPAVLYWPFNGPGTVSGSSTVLVYNVLGYHCYTGPSSSVCSATNSYTFDAPYTDYAFTSPVEALLNSNVNSTPNVIAGDTYTVSAHPCFGFANNVSMYSAYTPTICWGTAIGGFDFSPAVAVSGGKDYNFRNAAGSALITITDAGLYVLNATGVAIVTLPTSGSGGGIYVCVDSNGDLYKKSSCP